MLRQSSPDPAFAGAQISGYEQKATHIGPFRYVLAMLFMLSIPVAAQSVDPSAMAQDSQVVADLGGSGGAGIDSRMEARRMAALNQERQQQMVSDADKLLKLAKELNADADAGGTILSPAQRVQKAEEIEKLAKKVKDKMTFAIGAPQDLMGPFAAWQR